MHQKNQIAFEEVVKLVNKPLVKGDTWYMLDKNWYDTCKVYNESGDQTQHPGPIDNSALFQSGPTTSSDTNKTIAIADSSTTNGDCEMYESLDHGAGAVSVDSRPLKSDLKENIDFILVPETCWNLLKDTYGVINANHAIKRMVIEAMPGYPIVEISLVKLKLCLYGGKESTVEKCFSRTTTLDELQQEMRKVFNISPDRETKLWIDSQVFTFKANGLSPSKSENGLQQSLSPIKAPPSPPPMPKWNNNPFPDSNGSSPTVVTRQATNSMNNKPIALPDSSSSPPTTRSSLLSNSTSDSPIGTSSKSNGSSNQTFIDAGITETAVVTLEVINSDGTWPSSRPRYGTVSTRSSKAQPGLCGLSNMGNTCFMNAALQCLSNTPPLTNYILTDKYLEDINPTNPLGMHGEIARTYAELIKVMWSGNNTSFLPREFKCAVSRFAPQFIGFSQQDSQELMAFLLDGLHEDLNRIQNKPYIEIKNDIETRPDEVVAEESWNNYKKRNDSIVVDTFHAMLKSTLVCPSCGLVSVTFDPFCYLSLPLAIKQEKLTSLPATGDADKTNIKASGADSSATSSSESVEPSAQKVNTKPTLQLKDCITQFTSVERLGAYDPWYCPRCKKHQQATKKFDIWSLPKVLIIHLKRFSFSRSWRDKIDTLVEFPVDNLDMSEYVLNPAQKKQKMIYNLIGVSNHFGGLGGGHYTAFAKNSIQDAWYSFDDALVTQTSSKNVVTRSAYVLFYQLQEDNE